MSESAIRTQIFNIVSAVPDIGKVYDYERWTVDWGAFINLFKDPAGKILGWEISRKSFKAEIMVLGGASGGSSHVYILRGFLGVKDAVATEKAINELLGSIVEAFRQGRTLNGAGYVDSIEGMIETRTFGGMLCHCAELYLACREET